ncbi:tyrosine-type recombinase/integrase [Streptomyces sp. NPDC020096]
MTATALLTLPEAGDPRADELRGLLDPDFLSLIKWDWDRRVAVFPTDHPVLGGVACRIASCQGIAPGGMGLCTTCRVHWRRSGVALDDFVLEASRTWRAHGIQRCSVSGCARPWTTQPTALCSAHLHQRKKILKLPLADFLRHPDVVGLPSLGLCQVAACYRDRPSTVSAYCTAHGQRYRIHLSQGKVVDEAHWSRTTSAITVNREVSLRGLPPRLVAELLYTLQVRTSKGAKTRDDVIRPLTHHLLALQATSLEETDVDELPTEHTRRLARSLRRILARVGLSPETERHKDVWDITAFGHTGTLVFDQISQQPIREAMKIWAYDCLPRRRGKGVRSHIQAQINAVARLSKSLRLQREDGGDFLSALGRQDILSFCNRLAFQVADGQFSTHHHLNITRSVRRVLNRWRTLGLTRPGQVLEGLPADFVLDQADLPDRPEDTEAGRDLPDEVMRGLCDRLDLLEQMGSREIRVAVELIIDTGRRPDEICKLPYDCLEKSDDGSWDLLYDNHKAYRLGRRLPIGKPTVELIVLQQEQVRERFPSTPLKQLKLFPSGAANPDGAKAITGVTERHRAWVEALPDFLIPTPVEDGDKMVTKLLPFDKAKIFPYAYRHTYAQRHADAGLDIDVLRKLMDHRQLGTTQRYYRVRDERRRAAVDRITSMQFDRHGNRIWRDAEALMESERLRRSVGEVAVPYGICTEPSNVAASGKSCPLRFRCVGCGHFRTDASYLPDLEAYLADLLRNRERLLATFDADNWARTETMPSDEEIRRVRQLISRVKEQLDELTPEEHAQIEQAVAVVRRGRRTMLGMPKVRQPLPDVRPEGIR